MLFIVFGGSRKPKSTYTKTSYTNFVKTIIISDCHGQPHLITNALNHANNWSRLIFSGDILDIGPDPIKCLNILKENNAELLWGNHDAAIVINRPIWPQNTFDHEAKQTIINNTNNFKVATNINNVLVTHAGLSKNFMHNMDIDLNQGIPEIVQHLNKLNLETVWCDDSPLWYRPNNKNTPMPIMQVVGHTPPEWIERSGFKSDNFVSVDPYCTKGFGPDRYRYVAIEDGIATLYDSNETPKTIYNSK